MWRMGLLGQTSATLLGLGEVAEIEEAELAEAYQDAGGAGILSCGRDPTWARWRNRDWARLDAGNRADVFAIGGEHDDAEAGNVDGVAGMNDAARLAFDGLQVGGVVVARDVGVFAVDAVIEELADWHALDQFGHAAHVVDVEVGDQHGDRSCVMPASFIAAWMRSASRPLLPGQPVSTSSDAAGGRQPAAWPGRLRHRWSR